MCWGNPPPPPPPTPKSCIGTPVMRAPLEKGLERPPAPHLQTTALIPRPMAHNARALCRASPTRPAASQDYGADYAAAPVMLSDGMTVLRDGTGRPVVALTRLAPRLLTAPDGDYVRDAAGRPLTERHAKRLAGVDARDAGLYAVQLVGYSSAGHPLLQRRLLPRGEAALVRLPDSSPLLDGLGQPVLRDALGWAMQSGQVHGVWAAPGAPTAPQSSPPASPPSPPRPEPSGGSPTRRSVPPRPHALHSPPSAQPPGQSPTQSPGSPASRPPTSPPKPVPRPAPAVLPEPRSPEDEWKNRVALDAASLPLGATTAQPLRGLAGGVVGPPVHTAPAQPDAGAAAANGVGYAEDGAAQPQSVWLGCGVGERVGAAGGSAGQAGDASGSAGGGPGLGTAGVAPGGAVAESQDEAADAHTPGDLVSLTNVAVSADDVALSSAAQVNALGPYRKVTSCGSEVQVPL